VRIVANFILRFQLPLLLIAGLTGAFFLRYIPGTEMSEDVSTWFNDNDSVLIEYRDFQDTFNESQFLMVAYEWNPPFSGSELSYLSLLTDSLAKLPHIRDALSLTTVENISGTDYGLEIGALFDDDLPVTEVISNIRRHPFVYGNLISRDFHSVAIMLILEQNDDDTRSLSEFNQEVDTNLRNLLLAETARTGRQFHLGGELINNAAIEIMMERDIRLFFPLSMVISAVFLWLIFRNIFAILSPLLTVFLALVWVIGLKGYCESPITPVSTTLFALITIIGIANSVHLISQFRLEYAQRPDRKAAVLAGLTKAGTPCFFTSLTTAIGFGSLVTSSIPGIADLGIFAAIGIMSSYLLSIILIPAGLLRFPPPKPDSVTKQSNLTHTLLNKIADLNERYPLWVSAIFGIIVIVMALGIPRIRIEGSIIEYLKTGTRLYQDTQFLDRHLSGVSSTEIIIEGIPDCFKNPDLLTEIEAFQQEIAAHPRVSVSYSVTDYLKMIYRALNSDEDAYYRIPETRDAVAQCLLMYEISGGTEIEKYISNDYSMARISIITKQMNDQESNRLFALIDDFSDNHFTEYRVRKTGFDYLVNQLTRRIIATQITSLRTASAIILLLMLIIFGLRLGLLSLLPNVFPVVFILGLMGWAGFRLNMATAIIASVAIGIVVDDTIHFFTHFKYEYRKTGDIHRAMRAALTGVGRALIFASLILMTGFLIFILSDTRILMDFGILASIAIFTALLGDLFVGPVLLSSIDVLRKRFKK